MRPLRRSAFDRAPAHAPDSEPRLQKRSRQIVERSRGAPRTGNTRGQPRGRRPRARRAGTSGRDAAGARAGSTREYDGLRSVRDTPRQCRTSVRGPLAVGLQRTQGRRQVRCHAGSDPKSPRSAVSPPLQEPRALRGQAREDHVGSVASLAKHSNVLAVVVRSPPAARMPSATRRRQIEVCSWSYRPSSFLTHGGGFGVGW
jgi:hypothetical protein